MEKGEESVGLRIIAGFNFVLAAYMMVFSGSYLIIPIVKGGKYSSDSTGLLILSLMLIGLIAATWLIISSILLLKRKKIAIRLHFLFYLIYGLSGLDILLMPLYSLFGILRPVLAPFLILLMAKAALINSFYRELSLLLNLPGAAAEKWGFLVSSLIIPICSSIAIITYLSLRRVKAQFK